MNPIVVHLISSVVCTTLDSSRVFPKFQVHFFVYRIQCFKYTSSILIYPYHLLSLSIKFSTLLKSVLIQVGDYRTAFFYPTWIRTLFISRYLDSIQDYRTSCKYQLFSHFYYPKYRHFGFSIYLFTYGANF